MRATDPVWPLGQASEVCVFVRCYVGPNLVAFCVVKGAGESRSYCAWTFCNAIPKALRTIMPAMPQFASQFGVPSRRRNATCLPRKLASFPSTFEVSLSNISRSVASAIDCRSIARLLAVSTGEDGHLARHRGLGSPFPQDDPPSLQDARESSETLYSRPFRRRNVHRAQAAYPCPLPRNTGGKAPTRRWSAG